MSLPLGTTATLSCDDSQEYTGPTLVHSTGVPGYRISPYIIQILQQAFSNDNLCDNERGVECFLAIGSVIEALENAGFEITGDSNSGGRKIWHLTKTS